MKFLKKAGDGSVDINLSMEEAYIIMQATDEASQRMSDNDINSIMNSDRKKLKEIFKNMIEVYEKADKQK